MRQQRKSHPAAQQLVTIKDIADRCGVGMATVSRSLTNHPHVNAATRERVLAVAAEMGYDPAHHEAARRLSLRKYGIDILHHAVALLFPAETYRVNYYSRIFHGVIEELTKYDYALITMLVPRIDECSHVELPPVFSHSDIDGIIWCPGVSDDLVLAALQRNPLLQQCPTVGMLVKEVEDCSMVVADELGGVRRLMQHLLDLGHRDFLQIDGDGIQYARRLETIQQILRDNDLEPAIHLQLIKCPANWIDPLFLLTDVSTTLATAHEDAQYAQHLLQYLQEHPRISALLGLNDTTAIRCWFALQHAGYRVPEDISIVGFDDTDPMCDARGRSVLTTVRLPLEEIGREAVRLLVRQIEEQKAETVEITLPSEPVIRASTAAPAVRHRTIDSL